MPRPKNVIHEGDLPWTETVHGTRNASKRRRFGPAVGLQKLGASLFEVPPGKRAFPRHWHSANEEFLYLLAGAGTLRLGAETIEVSAGDFVSLPAGPQHVHELTNTGPDILHYPDSHKVMTLEGRGPDGKPQGAVLSEATTLDYWSGED